MRETLISAADLVDVPGPIPGEVMMRAFMNAGREESAKRQLIEMGIEIGPDEHRPYSEILEFIHAQEAETTL